MKNLLALLIIVGLSQCPALAVDCESQPNNCDSCNELLDGCDLPSTGFNSMSSNSNPSNPCYAFCHHDGNYEGDN